MGFRRLYRLAFLSVLTGGAVWLAQSRGGRSAWFLVWLLAGICLSALAVLLFNLLRAAVVRKGDGQIVVTGETLTVELRIRHLSLLPVLWLSVSDRFIREGNGEVYTVTKLVYPGMKRAFTIRYRVSGLERGEYRFAGTELIAGDWWGLALKRRLLPAKGGFTVLPQAKTVLPSALPRGTGGEDNSSLYRFGASAAGHIVREYTAGDPLHRIHWKSTARRGDLMTRVMEPAEELRFVVCLDGSRDSYKGALGGRLFEQGVEWAAGMLQAACDNSSAAGFACNSGGGVWLAPSSHSRSARSLCLLAGLSPDGEEPFAGVLLGRIMTKLPDTYAIVVISPVLTEESLAALYKLLSVGRQVLWYQISEGTTLARSEQEQKKKLELAGCRVLTVSEARMERAVRLDAEYEGA
jgi:uncharacterized protein (DUF58 family)